MSLSFLLRPQAKMPFDANKLYCSEVLAILLQNNDGETCLWYRYSVRVGSGLPADHNSALLPSAFLCSRSPARLLSHTHAPSRSLRLLYSVKPY